MFGFPLHYVIAGGAMALLLMVWFLVLVVRFVKSLSKPSTRGRTAFEISQLELAESAIKKAEEVRAVILWARSPDRRPGEGNSRPSSSTKEHGPHRVKRNQIYATIPRLNQRQHVFDEFDEVRRHYRASFGTQACRPLDVFVETRNLVIAHVEALIELDIAAGGNPRKENEKRRVLEVTAGLRVPGDGIDPVAHKLEEALIPMTAHYKSLV